MSDEKKTTKPARRLLRQACFCPQALHDWVKLHLELDVPTEPVCAGHDAPFDYLWSAYHEPADDLVVWAPRGGGKTRLGAVATLLDLLHKPGVEVRILAGSLEQSHKMWEHLKDDVERVAGELVDKKSRSARFVKFKNGSRAGVLAQSQRAVRGLRVQKLRCDEVELFDREVWEAAQLVTRSQSGLPRKKHAAPPAAGCVEAISTWHKCWGLMNEIITQAKEHGTKVIQWCILEVLERCPAERSCDGCALWDDCKGVAKTKCNGFFSIDDAIRLKQRVSAEMWATEMLCRRPSVRGRVFTSFEEAVHVRGEEAARGKGQGASEDGGDWQRDAGDGSLSLAMDFGFHNPFVCLWIATSPDGVTHVLDEYVQDQRTMHEHLQFIESKAFGKVKAVACDPAGAGRNDQTAESNVALLRRSGYSVRTRGSLIQDGIELIRLGLKPAAGEPTLYFHPRCVRLIRAMQSYHYSEAAGSELPVKDGEHDHLIDALRYHFVNRQGTAVKGRRY